MRVAIIKRETNKVVSIQEVNLEGLNYIPSDEEYFSEAWRCAVEDGIILDSDKKADFRFESCG